MCAFFANKKWRTSIFFIYIHYIKASHMAQMKPIQIVFFRNGIYFEALHMVYLSLQPF